MLPMDSVPAFSLSLIIPPTDPWVNQSQMEGNYKICKMIEGRKTLIFKTCPYGKLRVYQTQRSNVSELKGCIYLLNIRAFFWWKPFICSLENAKLTCSEKLSHTEIKASFPVPQSKVNWVKDQECIRPQRSSELRSLDRGPGMPAEGSPATRPHCPFHCWNYLIRKKHWSWVF